MEDRCAGEMEKAKPGQLLLAHDRALLFLEDADDPFWGCRSFWDTEPFGVLMPGDGYSVSGFGE